MNKNIQTILVLLGLLFAAVLLSGCVEEISNNATVTPSPTPQPSVMPTPTPSLTPSPVPSPSSIPTPEVTLPTLVKKEIHQDFDATPALAGLFEPAPLQPHISNITPEDIGFEVTITDDVSPILYTGKPMVPFIIKEFKIPTESHVESVIVNLRDPIEIRNVFIEPTPKLLYPIEYVIDNETYLSSDPYPGKEYDYQLSGDPIRGKEVVVHVFPIQYIPAESRIIAFKNASISIVYRVPVQEG
jgi:PBP1b-binding outer membrane lipoprotein LpoB